MSSVNQKKIENIRYPNVKRNWIKAIKAIRQTRNKIGVWNGGFSQISSFDRLTDEQNEDLIAENIYDWWISGKSYKEWYADKFLQTKLEFPEEE